MAHSVSAGDCIWYFVGEMRVAVTMGGIPIHYTGGANHLASAQFSFVAPHISMRSSVDFGDDSAPIAFQNYARSIGGNGFDRSAAAAPDVVRTEALEVRVDPLPIAVTRPFGTGQYLGPTLPPNPTLSYDYGNNPAQAILIGQANALSDGDTLTGDPDILAPSTLAAEHQAASNAVLQDLLAAVEQALPSSAAEVLQTFDSLKFEQVSMSDDVLALNGKGEDAPEVDANGSYVNGAKTSDAGETAEDQLADIEAVVTQSYASADDDADEPPTSNEAQSAGEPAEHVEVITSLQPDETSEQIANTGANQAINAAVLIDAGEAYGSLIVQGDFYKTNLIVQINALSDTDKVAISGDLVRDLIGAGNSTTNEASFIEQPGQLYGSPLLQGYAGTTNWNIDYNYGNLIDIALQEQCNILRDGDAADVTSTTTNVLMMLGENGQMNVINLTELGAQYDLIIVGGDYYKLNAILQMNILVDDDVVRVDASGNPVVAGANGVQTSGNVLHNDAAIIDSGSQSFQPLTGAPLDLIAAIEDGETEISGLLTIGLPGNGTPQFDVLYIAGNYYDYNVISQINLIYDADVLRMATGEGGEAVTQDALTGGNTAHNAAMIYDIGSTSTYQLLGGEAYEETLLVQADILIDDDDIVYTPAGHAGLDPDVVATVAGMVDGSGSEGSSSSPVVVTAADIANTDGLASILN